MKKSNTKTQPTIYEVEGKPYALINGQLVPIQVQPTNTEKERTDIKIPPHSRSEIPQLLNAMTKDSTLAYFGIMKNNPSDKPYAMVGISKFYRDNNIQVNSEKFERIMFTYEHKHLILTKQLQGETKTTINKVRQNCISYLQGKLKEIPTATRNGRPLTDKQKQGMTNSITAELLRWNVSN